VSRRPAAPEPRPGLALIIVALLLSPLVLLAWLAGAALLRATGWRRWPVAVSALAVATVVVWVEGGPVAAATIHFSGYWSLLSQFGRPLLHLPTPGSFLVPQVALSIPVGVLAATIARPGVALEGPDPAAVTRANRQEQKTRKAARKLAARTPSTQDVLGVSLGGDLDAWRSGRYVVLPDHAARLPRIVLGRPGGGKSVYLCREAFLAGLAGRQDITLDGKGDGEFTTMVVDAYTTGWQLTHPGEWPTVHLFPDEPLSVWQGTPAEVLNKLLGTWAWSLESQWYKELCVLALRLACGQPGPPVTSMTELFARLDPAALAKAWHAHPAEAGLVKSRRDDLGGVQVRMANLAAAAGGLLDGTRAIGDADLTIVSVPTMANRGDSESIFRILMADIAHWAAARKDRRPAIVAVDEFSAITGARDQAIDLLERGRGALVPVVLAGQSYRSLGDEDQRDRLVSAADALVLFGSSTPDELARLAGTVLDTEAVYTVEDGAWTGRASVARRHRAKVEPNAIRQLGVGEAIIVSRGRAERLLVIPAPQAGNALALPRRALRPSVGGTRALRSRVKAKLAALMPPAALTRPLDPGPETPPAKPGGGNPTDDRDNQEGTP
jgi:hypothetical protein